MDGISASRFERPAHTPLAAGMVLVAAALGSAVVAYAANPYPWAFSDSVAYVVSARNLVKGIGLGLYQPSGLFEVVTHFPPLYSLVLAVLSLPGGDLLGASRWLNAATWMGLVSVSGILVWTASRSLWMLSALLAMMVTSPLLVDLHSGVASEPLFLALMGLTMLLLARHLQTGGRLELACAAGCAGVATMARYAGIPFVAAVPLVVLVISPLPWKSRWTWALLTLAIGIAPLIAWSMTIEQVGADPVRIVAFGTGSLWSRMTPARIETTRVLWSILPWGGATPELSHRGKLVAMMALGTAAVYLPLRAFRKGRPGITQADRSTALLSVLAAIFGGTYLIGILASFLFVAPRPDIDGRILAPSMIPVWVILLVPFHLASHIGRWWRWMAVVPVLLALMAIRLNLPVTVSLVRELHQIGRGYTSFAWRHSELIAGIRALPEDASLVSNEAAGILLWTDRPAHDLPELLPGHPKDLFVRFGDDAAEPLEQKFREGDVLLVLFDSIFWQLDSVYPGRAAGRLASMTDGLQVVGDFSDGKIYAYPQEITHTLSRRSTGCGDSCMERRAEGPGTSSWSQHAP